ncbi:hypothetical protein FNV43_RR11958 [Rhamnella rubrinervis]|uniref:Uncharacterized protein n=1 Tax=Rhamnella rubrinervis TaxID=2594499 RepID=A0A8K0H708_9ROSA|nr:hypothetical protein FNV43_RR11958 [Rhamnella rubrinervis]
MANDEDCWRWALSDVDDTWGIQPSKPFSIPHVSVIVVTSEMDKARDVRRGASRFKHSGQKLFSGSDGVGGDFVFSENSKKEKLRRLSAVGKASSRYSDREMGCDVSDREDELRSIGPSKRFKLPKKFFDDYNGVDHASVPRKLRSAMKKRSRESISPPLPDSKRLNHTSGSKSHKKDGVKKPKPNMKQSDTDRSSGQTISGPITKDEEEVVETLYALAGMFPYNVESDKSKLDSEYLETDPAALAEPKETHTPVLEAVKDNLNSIGPLTTAETVNTDPLNEPRIHDQPVLQHIKKPCLELDDSVPQLHLRASSLSTKCESFDLGISSEVSPDTGLKQPPEPEILLAEREPEALGLPTTVGSQIELQHTIEESKKNGPASWPDLCSIDSHGAGIRSLHLQSSTAKAPVWLDAALSTSRSSSVQNGSSIGNVSKVANERMSCKRSAAHVYIGRLIQALQMSKSKDRKLLHQNRMRPEEGLKHGVVLGVDSVNGVNIGLNVVDSASSIGTVENNSNGAKSNILQQRRLHKEQPKSSPHSEGCTLHNKQSFDFLSLSAGVGGLDANDGIGITGKGLETLSQLQVPSHPSLVQHQMHLPFSCPPSRHNSCYHDPSSAHQAQLHPSRPYHGSQYYVPQVRPIALTKQQPQQQQQRLWAAQYRPVGTSTATMQFPNWQNERQDTSTLFPCAQTHISPPPSSSTLEVVGAGAKYALISQRQEQQQQPQPQMMGIRVIRQDHHLPTVYEETGGRFRAGSALPLQLLCNERL